ncbi:MAG: site-specific integrase [Desulfovibrionaceae bacterium]|nr:site-specific integrase [Desulfovibrionaceae bacterium]
MTENDSGMIAAKRGSRREKTRFPGVYSRKIKNKRTGKPDTAFDICYRDQESKFCWDFIGYASDGVNAAFANQRRGAILDGISRGEKPKRKGAGGMTFAQGWTLFDEKWLPHLVRPQEERNRFKRYLLEPLGHRRLDAITLMDLEDLKGAMLRRGLSTATVRLILSDVRRLYRKLTAWRVYSGPIPTVGLSMPKQDNARTRFLTESEAIKLLADLKKRSRTWHDIAFLSLHTGMRKGEILKLRGEHLDFAAGQVLVKDPKTISRIVHMTPEVRALLDEVRPAAPEDFVFRSRYGGAINIDADESYVRAVAACGLNNGITDRRHKVVFHTLRHTYCSWLAKSGVPLFTIGELVGHSSVEMTKRYSHLCPDAKQEAAGRIGTLMRQAREKEAARVATADHASSVSGTPGTS